MGTSSTDAPVRREHWRTYLSRSAVTFVFAVFGAWEVVQPGYWSAYVPGVLSGLPVLKLVQFHGLTLVLVGAALLMDEYVRPAAVLASLIMLEVTSGILLGSGFNSVLVRDVTILLLTLSVLVDVY